MNNSDVLVRLTEIENKGFDFYGNDCAYHLDVFNSKRVRIGMAMADVVQPGTDYSSAYEFLYDYDMESEEDRCALAEILGVATIADEWIVDGQLEAEQLPQEVCRNIENDWDESLMEYYYEDFAETADEEGFMPLTRFAERYIVRRYGGRTYQMDINLPLSQIFNDCGFYSECYDDLVLPQPIDVAQAGKEQFVDLAALVADEMEDRDLISAYMNITYGGDYSVEDEATEYMTKVFVETAYIIIRSMAPRMEVMVERDWIGLMSEMLLRLAVAHGFMYPDDSPRQWDDLSEKIFAQLANPEGDAAAANWDRDEMSAVVEQAIAAGRYPMSDEDYDRLLTVLNLKNIGND